MIQKVNKTRQILVAFILVAAITGLSSCEKYSFVLPKVNPVDTIHFQADIQPIFTSNCLTCHGAIQSPILKDGKSYQNLVNGGFVNSPAESSRLYIRMTTGDHIPRSTDVDKQKVFIWITQGALNN